MVKRRHRRKAPNQIRSIFQKYKPKLIELQIMLITDEKSRQQYRMLVPRGLQSEIVCYWSWKIPKLQCASPVSMGRNAREANRKRPHCLYPNRKRPPSSFPRRAGKYVQLDNFRHYKPTSKCYLQEIIAGTGNLEQLPDQY